MNLPSFISVRRPKRPRTQRSPTSSDSTIPPTTKPAPPTNSRPNRTRKTLLLLSALSFLIALPFLILVEIGTTYNLPVLRSTYFLKLDFSHIIPRTVPDAVLINSIARTLGLHDFYQPGLWGYCAGYDGGQGVTSCSRPVTMYWFNPVEILLNELLAGATSKSSPTSRPLLSSSTVCNWEKSRRC